jgi:hypothetical protein
MFLKLIIVKLKILEIRKQKNINETIVGLVKNGYFNLS